MIPSWPPERLGELVETLAVAAGYPAARIGTPNDVERAALRLGLVADVTVLDCGDLPQFLSTSGPALAMGPDGRWLGILNGGRLLDPEHRPVTVSLVELESYLLRPQIERMLPALERLLARVPEAAKARTLLLRQRLAAIPVQNSAFYLLRPAPGNAVARSREFGIPASLGWLFLLYPLSQILSIGGWWFAGNGLLSGDASIGLFSGWALMLLTGLPIQLAIVWIQGELAIRVGQLLKQRLLSGALQMDPDRVRQQGVGGLIARVDESQAIESLALSAGFSMISGLLSLVSAGWILLQGAGGWGSATALVSIIGIGMVLGALILRRTQGWTQDRMTLTADILANMVGYRTRLAQLKPSEWHIEEDQGLERYLRSSEGLDWLLVLFTGIFPGFWRIVGLLSLLPGVMGGASAGALAVGLGGVLYAHGAILQLSSGLSAAVGAYVAWKSVADLVEAGRSNDRGGAMPVPSGGVLELRRLSFHHPGQDPILNQLNLRLEPGARILLEGASGAGKSTLGAVIAGIRLPTGGLLMLNGLDRRSAGADAWRRQVVLTPQFHENHIITETLSFNLLMGHDWPASPEKLDEAQEVCEALGLGPLLSRMSAGIHQMVGEGGWKLSHGEQGRVMLARALLQDAQVVVLDESFAALDPETLEACLETVFARAPTLLVIAHP